MLNFNELRFQLHKIQAELRALEAVVARAQGEAEKLERQQVSIGGLGGGTGRLTEHPGGAPIP